MAKKNTKTVTDSYTFTEPNTPPSTSEMDATGPIRAVTVFQNPDNAQEYIAATLTILPDGTIAHVEMDAPSEYRIASMNGKVRFSQIFLHGPELLNSHRQGGA